MTSQASRAASVVPPVAPAPCSPVPATRAELASRPVVLFDFDGTLADTKPGIVATARATLSEWGMTEAEMGDLTRLIGPPFPYAYCDVYGMSREDAEEVSRRYSARYAKLGPAGAPLFPGMAELLRDLSASGRTLAVASSKAQVTCEEMLVAHGVRGLFAAVVGKRDPEHAQKDVLVGMALEELVAAPADAVMVGDRFYDVRGAAANGVPCVGVCYGGTGTREELVGAGAAAVAASVAELRSVLMG